jgi:chemotaxis protein methyltransferase CheR
MGTYDIIFCRNVLLYFSPDMRRKAFDRLSHHSKAGGMLLMGAGETTIGLTENFSASRTFRGCYERAGDAGASLTYRLKA